MAHYMHAPYVPPAAPYAGCYTAAAPASYAAPYAAADMPAHAPTPAHAHLYAWRQKQQQQQQRAANPYQPGWYGYHRAEPHCYEALQLWRIANGSALAGRRMIPQAGYDSYAAGVDAGWSAAAEEAVYERRAAQLQSIRHLAGRVDSAAEQLAGQVTGAGQRRHGGGPQDAWAATPGGSGQQGSPARSGRSSARRLERRSQRRRRALPRRVPAPAAEAGGEADPPVRQLTADPHPQEQPGAAASPAAGGRRPSQDGPGDSARTLPRGPPPAGAEAESVEPGGWGALETEKAAHALQIDALQQQLAAANARLDRLEGAGGDVVGAPAVAVVSSSGVQFAADTKQQSPIPHKLVRTLTGGAGLSAGEVVAPRAAATDTRASKRKTRLALLGGLRDGRLEAAVASIPDSEEEVGEEEVGGTVVDDVPSTPSKLEVAASFSVGMYADDSFELESDESESAALSSDAGELDVAGRAAVLSTIQALRRNMQRQVRAVHAEVGQTREWLRVRRTQASQLQDHAETLTHRDTHRETHTATHTRAHAASCAAILRVRVLEHPHGRLFLCRPAAAQITSHCFALAG